MLFYIVLELPLPQFLGEVFQDTLSLPIIGLKGGHLLNADVLLSRFSNYKPVNTLRGHIILYPFPNKIKSNQ